MPARFFISATVVADEVTIDGALAAHIARSLRMRAGEVVVVVDGERREHGVRLHRVTATEVAGEVLWSRDASGEPGLRIAVLQAIPQDKMEDCIDALVEVGAASIHPVLTERVVVRPVGDRLARRVDRWRTVASESAQLAGRGMVPRVHEPVPLEQALGALPAVCRVIACTFDASTALADVAVDRQRPLALCIGPEGGLGEGDLAVLTARGAESAHLGGRVLRTRYAGAIACALLLGRAGDLAQPVAAGGG